MHTRRKILPPEIPVSRYLAEVYLSCDPRDAVQRVNTVCWEIPVTQFRLRRPMLKISRLAQINPQCNKLE